MQELVSCIITTYKRKPEILKRAIDSVLNQTYKNCEIIVVNDYPEDKRLCDQIEALVANYSANIHYILHPHNMGACQARNTGIRVSKGNYIALLDDDDEWMPLKIEEQLKLFDADDVGLVYCDSIIRRDGKDTKHHCVSKKYNDNIISALLYRNFIGGNSFPLIKKQALIDAGMYDIDLKALQDLDMWIRIAQIYRCKHCEQFLLINHISDVSITTISDNRISAFKRILNKYERLYRENPDLYHERLLEISADLLISGRRKEAYEFYDKAIEIKPVSIKNIVTPVKSIILKIRKRLFKY